ncbi:phosphatase PAP2 family protein [Pajaroellobacter abortibovis]|uniref:Inositolphosphotransferase Aur1/Ipt1 domain-containing protein n=1 Tax=Pajaroellobacter abortibovis TaxID=1882918 RepID=A0A1L6MWY9_9BACT|nr:phosphatase PAP2 family protein [Pajaroellobacter abortibovis]APS00063.1 hypothetical protein BCY86_04740 [Pajaroellobacter abortibovis]
MIRFLCSLIKKRRFEFGIGAPPIVAAIASWFGLHGSPVSIQVGGYGLFAILSGTACTLAVMFYEHRDPRLAEIIRIATLGLLLSNAYAIPMYWIAAHGGPFVDPILTQIDASCGIHVASWVLTVRSQPALDVLSTWFYHSLPYELLGALLIPPLLGHVERAREFLLALLYASILSLGLFVWIQGIGPWTNGHFEPTEQQAATEVLLKALHSKQPVQLALSSPGPLIAFPSWHTIFAILAAFAFRYHRGLSIVTTLWSGAIIAATAVSGWHYMVDVAGGIGIAWFAIGATRATSRLYPLYRQLPVQTSEQSE